MGLGLSYVARLAEAYGGTVEEIGSWGKGAHFVVRIPLTERD
jgi:signal transduction histidine kinase